MQVAHGMIEDMQGCYGALGKLPGRISLNRLLWRSGLTPVASKDRMFPMFSVKHMLKPSLSLLVCICLSSC